MAAAKKKNGHDPATSQMVELLTEIRDELRGVNRRIDETNNRIDETNNRIDETNNRIDALKKITENAHRHIHERIDDVEEPVAGPGGLAERVSRLEAAVFKKAG